MKSINSTKLIFLVTMVVLAAMARLIPHWPNFTPIAAMALFGGAFFSNRWLGLAIPIAALLISDFAIGFYGNMWAVYACFIAIGLIGWRLKSRVAVGTVIGASIVSSLLFFIITNLVVWVANPLYSQDLVGLLACYAAAIPFSLSGDFLGSPFFNTVLGDLFYCGVLFGAYHFASLRFPKLAKQTN